MIDFVPLEYYYPIFMNGTLIIVLFTLLHTAVLKINDPRNISFINVIGFLMLVFLIFYIGLRPVSGRYFVDMRTYATHFEHYRTGGEVISKKDVFFHYFMKFSSQIMSVHSFFLICATVYLYPMYRVSKAFFHKYWFYSFLLLVVSLSFWTYGVNGIRNGMATSLFLMAISFKDRKLWTFAFFILASLFHRTLLLPIGAYLLTLFYNDPKSYLKFWLVAIPLSIVLGGFWTSLFTALGFADDRLGAYLSSQENSGFRFDFLIYSASAVVTGWYFIYKKGFKDLTYYHLYNTYLITNAFWILVIRANFSNRFAYLSWFMMAVVIIYPFLVSSIQRQNLKIGRVIFCYAAFTYFMTYVYYG
ncbi:EpsG family protein [Flavobacteriaceae bacterium 3-367]